jgi:hypothetical protein
MRNWSPRTRNYWGQKQKRDSIPSDQDESDTASVRSPMPWEPQDTTPDSTNYWQEDNSEYEDYGNTPALKTIVITPEPSSPIWENGRSVIDTLKGKPPEDIDPQNFMNAILKNMLKNKGNSSIPKAISNNVISGNAISSSTWDGRTGEREPGLSDLDLRNFHLENVYSKEPKPWYGNFVGPGPDMLANDTGKQPINLIDWAASKHDDEYFIAQATGWKGAVFNATERVINADRVLIKMSENIINMYLLKKYDRFSKSEVNYETYSMAIAVKFVFEILVAGKVQGTIPAFYNVMKDPNGALIRAIQEVSDMLYLRMQSASDHNANSRWFE